MNKLKKFLEQKKVDAKFKVSRVSVGGWQEEAMGKSCSKKKKAAAKREAAGSRPSPGPREVEGPASARSYNWAVAGKGQSLTTSSQPSAPSGSGPSRPPPAAQRSGPGSSAAAAAALSRFSATQEPSAADKAKTRSARAIKDQAARELAAETEASAGAASRASPGPREVEVPAQLAASARPLLFTCDILGDSAPPMTRGELEGTIEAFLTAQMEEEPVVAAALMCLSLNRSSARAQGLPALAKYISNARGHPDDPKFRRIRLGNKVFQEKVLSLRGGRQLLEGVGFRETAQPASDGADPEPFLVLEQPDMELLQQAEEMLEGGRGVEVKVFRDRRVLQGDEASRPPDIPDSFFRLTKEEVASEAGRKKAELEDMRQLKTAEMRAKEAAARRSVYKYCLVRVRFPQHLTLEGTFSASETLGDVMKFVQESLEHDWAPFSLSAPGGLNLLSAEEMESSQSLAEAGLCPASVLSFGWDAEVRAQWEDNAQPILYLKEQLLAA